MTECRDCTAMFGRRNAFVAHKHAINRATHERMVDTHVRVLRSLSSSQHPAAAHAFTQILHAAANRNVLVQSDQALRDVARMAQTATAHGASTKSIVPRVLRMVQSKARNSEELNRHGHDRFRARWRG